MQKLLIAVAAATIAVSGFALTSQADEGNPGTSWNYAQLPAKKGKPAGTDSLIKPAQENSDGSIKETKKTTINFPQGTSFDTSVPPRCKLPEGEFAAANGAGCEKSRIGQGYALSKLGNLQSSLETSAELTAFNKKGGILFLIRACQPGGTGPSEENPNAKCSAYLNGGTIVLTGTLKYKDKAKTKPILIVPTPPVLLQQHIVITLFNLVTNKFTKTVRVNGRKVLVSYVINPSKCKGTWKSSAKIEYDDGTGQTIPDSQPCKK